MAFYTTEQRLNQINETLKEILVEMKFSRQEREEEREKIKKHMDDEALRQAQNISVSSKVFQETEISPKLKAFGRAMMEL